MRLKLSIMLSFSVLIVACACFADTWTDSETGYTWTYRIIGDTAKIYNQYSAAISPKPTGAVAIPAALGDKPVTSIGAYAFTSCSGLTSVTIPDGVASIEDWTFSSCSGLTNVTIPDSVTSISSTAFSGCYLSSYPIPANVKDVHLTGLKWKDPITGYTWTYQINGDTAEIYGDYSDEYDIPCISPSPTGSVIIPVTLGGKPVTSLGRYAFSGCSGLTGVTIPDGVTNVSSTAFSRCYLSSYPIPANVRNVHLTDLKWKDPITGYTWTYQINGDTAEVYGANKFDYYYYRYFYVPGISPSPTNAVSIPVTLGGKTVTSIGHYAFSGCSGLTDVTIPDSVTNISSTAFSDCYLSSYTIPPNVKNVHLTDLKWKDPITGYTWTYRINGDTAEIYGTFYYYDYGEHVNGVYHSPCISPSPTNAVTIPATLGGKTVTSIGDRAFEGCSGLTSVTIPESVTSIGWIAFKGCSGLTSVTIPDGVTSIGDSAFSGCSGLTTVYIPLGYTGRTDVFPSATTVIRPRQVVTFDAAGGTVSPATNIVEYGSAYGFLPEPSRAGYAFAGWKWKDQSILAETTVTALDNHTLSAQWDANGYTMTFDANGGTGSTTNTQYYGSNLTLPSSAMRPGFVLVGWFTEVDGGTKVSETTKVSGDATYYAHWEYANFPPKLNPVGKEDTLVIFATVYDLSLGKYIDADRAQLMAFDMKGECRGVATIMNGPMGRLFQLSVGIESVTEKGIVLKIWNPETGETGDVFEHVTANGSRQIGSIAAPIEYKTGHPEMEVTLNPGWTWISTCLVAYDQSVDATFAGRTFAEDDVVKTATGFSTYYRGAWYPSSFKIEPGVSYAVKKSAGGAERVLFRGPVMSDRISVRYGWNWIGSTVVDASNISDMKHTAGFQDNDMVKSINYSATYYGGEWYPSEFALEPGVGYRARFSKPGTLSFTGNPKAAPKSASVRSLPKVAANNAEAGREPVKPDWTPVVQEETMVTYIQVQAPDGEMLEAEGSVLAAFSSSGECRGVAELMEGPLSRIFPLSIGVSNVTETGFVLKLWDAGSGKIYDIQGTINGNADRQLGKISSPIVKTADPRSMGHDVTFDANGGTVGELARWVANGGVVGTLPEPAPRTGYTFTGWWTSASGGTQVSAETKVTEDVTFYAHWTAVPPPQDTTGKPDMPSATDDAPVYAGRLNTSFAKAQTVLGALYGRNGVPVGTVQVKVGKVSKKGMVRISASATLLVDGKAKKVAAKAVSVVLDATGRVPPVKVAFKAPIGEMTFEMEADGTFTLKNASYVMAEKSVGGKWSKAGAKVWLAGTLALPAGTIEELLPDGEPVIPKAGKWSFAKAASVKYAKDKATGAFNLVIDDTRGTNRSAMKLTYTPKTGIFNGSFKIYAIQGGKLKKFTAKVIGVVIDGKGWGSATGPAGASFAVTVE